LLALLLLAYILWRRNYLARCGAPYSPIDEDSRLGHLKSALNIRLYSARGATPTRMDADCNFHAPAKGSFAVSRLGLVRGAPSRDQRRHISEACNKDNYGDHSESGLRALEISKQEIEPGVHRKDRGRGAVVRSNSMLVWQRAMSEATASAATATSLSETERSDSPEFGRKNAMSLEEKAASAVRQQAVAYSQRARTRAREERMAGRVRCRGLSEPARDEADEIERRPSFIHAQRELLEKLHDVDHNVNVAQLMGDAEAAADEAAAPAKSPKAQAHSWLSEVMAASLIADMEKEEAPKGDPQRALARARGRAASTPGSAPPNMGRRLSFDRKQKLARARASKTPSNAGELGRSNSFSRRMSAYSGGKASQSARSLVSSARSLSFSRKTGSAKTAAATRTPTQAELLRAAASSYAQNHRLNSRVPGSDGLDPTTSALFEARTMNVALPPPLISTGKDEAGAARSPREQQIGQSLSGGGSEGGMPSATLTTPVRNSISCEASSNARERVSRARRDSASRARAAGVAEDPTKEQARHKYEGMAAEVAEIAKRRSFSRAPYSGGTRGEAAQPDGRGSWRSPEMAETPSPTAAAPDRGGTPPVKWRAVGATPTPGSGETRGPSPRQNSALQI